MTPEEYATLQELVKIPGLVWKKSENYQKAYRLVPFEVPQEWLDMDKED